ncbi:hypothetical protein ACLMJK_003242 [Lecanora helva]
MNIRPRLTYQDYTVGWLCAVAESELVAAKRMLDRTHRPPANPNQYDENTYVYGDINGHNVVIACMPPGQPGPVSAQKLVQPLKQSFPNLNIHLFVGIGGGVPRVPTPEDPNEDIHLGDVVVGWPDKTGIPAVIQHDFERVRDDEPSSNLGVFNKPSRQLLNALNPMLIDRETKELRFHEHLQRLADLEKFRHPGVDKDALFKANYHHTTSSSSQQMCSECDRESLVKRPRRKTINPQFHQSTILSGSAIMQNGQKRDELSRKYYNAICIEMEAAGVIDDTHCLVIRGISDYADSHKPSMWRQYAAATAASFAREILCIIQPALVKSIKSEENDPHDKVLSILEKGERFVQPRHDHIAEDMEKAFCCFHRAQDMLIDLSINDPELNLRTYFRLMTLECDLTNDRELSAQDKMKHMGLAEGYERKAMNAAFDSERPDARSQVKLEQAFLKGRRAEIESERGTHPDEIRRVKTEALGEMDTAMEELQRSNIQKHNEYQTRVSAWQRRLA